MLKFFLKYYLPIIFVAGIIFYFSGIPGLKYGSESTAHEIILRKGAHFVEYAILSFFLWRAFFFGQKFSARKSFWGALIIAILYGASDEFHQSLTFARTGKIIDGVFDGLSALFILEMLYVFVRKKTDWGSILSLIFSALSIIFLIFFMIEKNHQLLEKMNQEEKIIIEKREQEKKIEKEEREIEKKLDEEEIEKEEEAPSTFKLEVSFTSQAPFFEWDHRHQEACEEASLLMLKYFLDKKELTPQIAEKEIQEMIDFQIKKYGFFKDTTAEQTVRLAKDFYGLTNLKVVYDFSKDDLRKELLRGFPIIIPAAGQMLGNPYFSGEGPLYHMLLVIGYNGENILTNDPGTRRGENYSYNEDVLYQAIHDFTGDKEKIRSGRKAMIVVE